MDQPSCSTSSDVKVGEDSGPSTHLVFTKDDKLYEAWKFAFTEWTPNRSKMLLASIAYGGPPSSSLGSSPVDHRDGRGDGESPDTELPIAEVLDAEAPDAEEPDAEAPDAEAPDTELPIAEVLDAEAPDAEAPDAEEPDAEAPDAEAPDAEAPDAEAPDAEVPDAEAPEAEAPDAEAPDAKAPDAKAPDAEAPDAMMPNTEITDTMTYCEEKRVNEESDANQAIYSRKVFVGGLPIDIDAECIQASFVQYGMVHVSWPHKIDSQGQKACPPKGFCFLHYKEEKSVRRLVKACLRVDNDLYTMVTSPTMGKKPVQIRPWVIADAAIVLDTESKDLRKTVFVGGLPRPVTASQLASLMAHLYGVVAFVAIDTDSELRYPKGSARVVFSHYSSMVAAVKARFVVLELENDRKQLEIKPFVLQNQGCDECRGELCDNKIAPFYCSHYGCLMYLCPKCWAEVHALPGRQFHKPSMQKVAKQKTAIPHHK